MNYPLRMAVDWLVILVTLILADRLGPWAWWPAALIIGSRQHALGEIGHMAMHGGRKWLCRLAFLPLGVSPATYRWFHLAHHRHLGDPLLDPEIAVYAKWPERWTRDRRRDLVLDALGLHAGEAIITIQQISTPYTMGAQAITVLALALIWPIVLLWPVAAITGLMLCHRIRARKEHRALTHPWSLTQPDVEPPWWEKIARPHGCWRHDAHHNNSGRA